jgi:zinc transporter ZupT
MAPWTFTLIALLAGVLLVVFVVDWSKHRRLLTVLAAIALAVSLYQSGLIALVPGASSLTVTLDSLTHFRPMAVQVVQVQVKDMPDHQDIIGEQLVLDVLLTNTGDKPIDAYSHCELHDVRGREFAMSGFLSPASLELFNQKLNPGLASTASATFDVPSARGLWWVTFYPHRENKRDGSTIPFIVW